MGSAMGNPIDDAAQERINNLIKEICQKIVTYFAKGYAQAVIEKAKNEIEPETSIEDDLKLQTAPTPSAIMKSGMLTKRGDAVKSWKQRFFVAYNAKDNFKIDYLDGTNESGKLKGTIWCAGYYASHFNSDETVEIGEWGIKLVPWSYRRRTWYIKCADEADRKEWMNVFENACYKSKPPSDEDECIASAFTSTISQLRSEYGFWGWYADAGTEGERLGEFVLDVLDREILNGILDGIAESPAKSMTVDVVRKAITASVRTACGAAWSSAVSAVRASATTVESKVKDSISPIIEKQNQFKDKISEKILDTITPFLSSKGSEVLRPILNIIFKPITDAFVLAVKGFHAHMSSKITSNEFATSRFTSTLDYTDWQLDWWSGPIHKAYEVLHAMYSNDLATVANLFVGGITPYTVYNMVIDKLRLIMHRAVFTFGSLAKAIAEGELGSVLSHVTSLLFHDSYIMIRSVISDVLKSLIDAPLQELVITPAKKLIEPLQAMVDQIPVINTLIDLPGLVDDVVGNVEDGSIASLISGSVNDIKSTFGVAGAELGIGSLTLN
eukprot:gene9540-12850_t